jgi:hypothetical protein
MKNAHKAFFEKYQGNEELKKMLDIDKRITYYKLNK